jgi:diadenosine tetraphosphate (Ap4A) HIT family hydrolase
LIGTAFEHLAWMIPINRISESGSLLVFPHPAPSFRNHILLVPKRRLATLNDLLDPACGGLLSELIQAAKGCLESDEWKFWSLGVNAGAYQDVMQVHFHLYAERVFFEREPCNSSSGQIEGGLRRRSGSVREIHYVATAESSADAGEVLRGALEQFLETGPPQDGGFTVFIDWQDQKESLDFHIVSGPTVRDTSQGSA